MRLFKDRLDAARELAGHLAFLKGKEPLVLGIPNYGVPIAAVVADALDAPLDILLVAKLSAPRLPEQIVGAVDEHGRISMIQAAARWHHLTAKEMIGPARAAFAELERRRARFRAISPEMDVRGREVVIVDHGVETGATFLAATASVRDRGARRVVTAAPAGCGKATWQLHETADTVVIPHTPSTFKGIEHFYDVFDAVSDQEVEMILKRWATARPEQHPGVKTLVMRVVSEQERVIHCELELPPGTTRGSGPYPAVIFAHSLESEARSPRSVPVSRRLAKRGIIGVRMDFTGHGRSEGTIADATDEKMLSDLWTVYENVRILQEVDENRIGLNGSGTGGMIALRFAAEQPAVAAMVIRGPVCGREAEAARHVKAPTLLIHAERDVTLSESVHALDKELASAHQLLQIPDCSRWFNDPVSLELMVSASVDWLVDHLTGVTPPVATAEGQEGEANGQVSDKGQEEEAISHQGSANRDDEKGVSD
ncbi:MAG: serine aminopeptidase domain-containing protein [Planctomycetota bacterium]|jgi:putative phosphoribosyl transferase